MKRPIATLDISSMTSVVELLNNFLDVVPIVTARIKLGGRKQLPGINYFANGCLDQYGVSA